MRIRAEIAALRDGERARALGDVVLGMDDSATLAAAWCPCGTCSPLKLAATLPPPCIDGDAPVLSKSPISVSMCPSCDILSTMVRFSTVIYFPWHFDCPFGPRSTVRLAQQYDPTRHTTVPLGSLSLLTIFYLLSYTLTSSPLSTDRWSPSFDESLVVAQRPIA